MGCIVRQHRLEMVVYFILFQKQKKPSVIHFISSGISIAFVLYCKQGHHEIIHLDHCCVTTCDHIKIS